MNLLFPRPKSLRSLRLLLCASMVCPPMLTLTASERDDLAPWPGLSAPSSPRPTLHRPDRKAGRAQQGWTIVADEPEAAVDLDDVRYTPPAIPSRAIDFPGLVPTPLQPIRPGLLRPVALPQHAPPLRC